MLIVSQGGTSTRLERQSFQDEAALQLYIHAHPEAIPLSDADDQPRLHVLGREFPTSSGPIDILGTDAAGEAYIIETKLYKNPDKRLVLAQVLDYGAALWAAEPDGKTVLEALRHDATKRGAQEPLASLAAFLDGDEDAAATHLEKVRTALAEGRFTALVLMDRLNDRLRDLVRFMNANSGFLILAVEFDYYRHGDTELVCPRLFGAETRGAVKRAAGNRRGSIDPEVYLQEYAKKSGNEAVDAWRSIEVAMQTAAIPGIEIGHRPSGTPYIFLSHTAIGEVEVFTLAPDAVVRDRLHVNSGAFDGQSSAREARQKFRRRLIEQVPGAVVSGGVGRVYLPLASFAERREAVVSAVVDLARDLGASEAPAG